MVRMEFELSKAIEARALDQIHYLQEDIGELNCLREAFSEDWEIVELTRAIIHEETRLIQFLQMEVESARTARKESERI